MRTSRIPLSALLGLLLGASAPACGSTSIEVRPAVTSPFTAEHAAVFDDGLDLVGDPRMLEGAWIETWERDLDLRVSAADVVALVTVRALRTDIDLEQRQTYRLVTHVDRTFLGQVSEDLTLSVVEGQGGFGFIRSNERRLLDEQYIAFVKWFDDAGTVRARWHLAPATEPVALRVRDLLRSRRDVRPVETVRRRVIIRD